MSEAYIYIYIYILLVITEIKLSKVGSVEGLRELANLKKEMDRSDFFFNYHSSSETNQIQL